MTRVANVSRRDSSHAVDDKVWLSTKNLPLKLGTRKLAAIWAGPFRVLDQIGPVAYRLKLPTDWNIHNVFHSSQLKSVVGDVEQEQELLVESGETEFEIERVLDSRVVRGSKQYLVKWKGYADYDNSWVAEQEMGNA